MLQNLITSILNNKPKFSKDDARKGANELNAIQNVMQLIIYDYENTEYAERDQVAQCLHEAFGPILHEGFEPSFDNGHCWGYPILCDCICLIKNKDYLWEVFSDEEHARFDLIMRMFALMWNFGCNKFNSFRTGISLYGNFRKDWGPNYQLTNNILMPFLINYFGSIEAVNELFTLEHSELTKLLKKYDFQNALSVWNRPEIQYTNGTTAPSAAFLYGYKKPGEGPKKAYDLYVEDHFGNKLHWGYGAGCQIPAGYIQFPQRIETNLEDELVRAVLSDCFNGGNCVSRIFLENEGEWAECADSVISPYEGKEGMMREFNWKDAYGVRTSLWHCELDFVLVYAHMITLKFLDILDVKTVPEWDKISVGMNDFIFKKQNNYKGYSMGNYEDYLKPLSSEFWINKWCEENK